MCGFQWAGLLSLFTAITSNEKQLPAQAAPKTRTSTPKLGARASRARVHRHHFSGATLYTCLSEKQSGQCCCCDCYCEEMNFQLELITNKQCYHYLCECDSISSMKLFLLPSTPHTNLTPLELSPPNPEVSQLSCCTL